MARQLKVAGRTPSKNPRKPLDQYKSTGIEVWIEDVPELMEQLKTTYENGTKKGKKRALIWTEHATDDLIVSTE